MEKVLPSYELLDLAEFTVYGIPKAAPRPRSRIVTARPGWVGAESSRPGGVPRASQFVQVYADKSDAQWKAQVAAAGRGAFEGPPVRDMALLLTITGILPRPKSVKKSKRPFPWVKPDLDNLVKAVKDALTGVIWHDDALIVGYGPETWKIYDDDALEPGARIIVWKVLC